MTLKIVETITNRIPGKETKVTQKRLTLTDNWEFFNIGPATLLVSDNRYEGSIESNRRISVSTNHGRYTTRQVDLTKPGNFLKHKFRLKNDNFDNPPTSSTTVKIHVKKVS